MDGSETTSRVTEEESALVLKSGKRSDDSCMESISDDEMFSDEEAELLASVKTLFRPKSKSELQMLADDKKVRLKRTLKKVKVPGPDQEIFFWNPAAKNKVVIGLQLREIEQDMEFLYSGKRKPALDGKMANGYRVGSERHGGRTGEGNVSSESTAGGSSGASGNVPQKRVRSSRNGSSPLSRKFSMHRSRKGWLVCNKCRAAIWPPNSRKHALICG
ncbi:hypothetical protein NDN08_006994 [Rhodosorus marinus]|uniref:Uncharacterized protein n=1 Tax=Rhodosorus marinus TaxID=101924 RepID=A0AAV8UM32_9RHOD|nr:hypothetical protein NDN08_006994 [Rhodosorus marinus]